ncbi:MAG: hypothetical protein KGV43_02420 [Arcobacter sp.]|nr:hypothetical protein [Arcobacter sp.]
MILNAKQIEGEIDGYRYVLYVDRYLFKKKYYFLKMNTQNELDYKFEELKIKSSTFKEIFWHWKFEIKKRLRKVFNKSHK